ncbi:hypothetical protein [uncultured Faecalibaculum sp.]|uniref:hypothetical protein n=1 Tax=uncultured Faecalibaculum sp. TaxID=1729681 RepID=UPI0025E8AC4D|nr:hypothetical protein [uncultured Faecalibaculum sp.]
MEIMILILLACILYLAADSTSRKDKGSSPYETDSGDSGLTKWEEEYTIHRFVKKNRERRHQRWAAEKKKGRRH